MTKKEQAAFDELEQKLRIAKAFNWTQPVAPDLPPPTGDKFSKGFDFNAYSNRVEPACSDSASNYFGSHKMPHFASRGAHALYSTRKLALQAMRHEVEKECAVRLAAIDKQIEQEGAA